MDEFVTFCLETEKKLKKTNKKFKKTENKTFKISKQKHSHSNARLEIQAISNNSLFVSFCVEMEIRKEN